MKNVNLISSLQWVSVLNSSFSTNRLSLINDRQPIFFMPFHMSSAFRLYKTNIRQNIEFVSFIPLIFHKIVFSGDVKIENKKNLVLDQIIHEKGSFSISGSPSRISRSIINLELDDMIVLPWSGQVAGP